MVARRVASLLAWALGLLALATLTLAGYTGYQALQVKTSLETVAGELELVVEELRTGETRSARERLVTVQDEAAVAAQSSNGPGWWLASRAPTIGDDVSAVRTVADVADVLAQTVMPAVLQAGIQIERIDPYDGRAAIDRVEGAVASLSRANEALGEQEDRLAAIPVDDLHPRLAEPIEQVRAELAGASDYLRLTSREARRALEAVPGR